LPGEGASGLEQLIVLDAADCRPHSTASAAERKRPEKMSSEAGATDHPRQQREHTAPTHLAELRWPSAMRALRPTTAKSQLSSSSRRRRRDAIDKGHHRYGEVTQASEHPVHVGHEVGKATGSRCSSM